MELRAAATSAVDGNAGESSQEVSWRVHWPYRYMIFFLGHLTNVLSYADRTNISLAILPMRAELGLGDYAEGACLSAFFVGYATTQIIGGLLTLRYGSKAVLCGALGLCSLTTLSTPVAARTSFALLIAARVALGAAEGCLLPALHALAIKWAPLKERTTAAALQTSGQYVGSCVALLCGGLAATSWPALFYMFGAGGVGWLMLFATLGSSRPDLHRCVTAAELAHIREGKLRLACSDYAQATSLPRTRANPAPDASEASGSADLRELRSAHRGGAHPVPWRRLLTNRACLAIYVSLATHNWSWYLLLSWLPTFLTQEQGVDLAAAGSLSLLPYVLAASCSNLGAAVADRLMLSRWQWSATRTRKVINLAGQLGPCVALFALALTSTTSSSMHGEHAEGVAGPQTSTSTAAALTEVSPRVSPGPVVSAALAAMAIGSGALTQAGCWSNMMDVAPRHVSVLLGIANTLGTLPGIICNLLTGAMLSAGWGWRAVFALGCLMEIIGATVYGLLASGEDQDF